MLLALTFGPMGAGIISYIIGQKSKKVRDYFADICAVLEIALLIYLSMGVINGSILEAKIDWMMSLSINLKLDGFRVVYGLVAAFMWAVTTIFSGEYMQHYSRTNRYYMFFLITLGATVGVFLSADLITTFLFFEIMSFTSYVWVAHDQTKDALRAAETYLAVAVIGGMIMLFGLFLLYDIAGTLSMDELYAAVNNALAENPEAVSKLYVSGACMLIGFGAKAGMFPLHIWLPKAHPVAPAPASALLSGILTKSGIYGVLVISSEIFLHDYAWGLTILVLGTITMFGGALLGVFSVNLKRTLACSSMSQIGFILVGIGMQGILGEANQLAIRGTILHMINHSLIKLVLFVAAGIVYMNLHKLDLNEIRGFGRGKIILTTAFAIGALSISGVPMFSGYISKTLLHESIVEYMNEVSGTSMYCGFKIIECIFLITGGMTFCYMLKLFVAVFIEKPVSDCKMAKVKKQKNKSYKSKQTYMNAQTVLAISLAALILFVLGICPYRMMDKISLLSMDFCHGVSEIERVNYFGFTNLKGSAISLTIGVVLYVLFVRKCLVRTNEKGERVYVDLWPQWFDIENLIYRPLIQQIIPFVLGFIFRVFDRLVDFVVFILNGNILKMVEPKRPLLFGNWFTHLVGQLLDNVVMIKNRTINRKNPATKDYEKRLAYAFDAVVKKSRLVAKSVSFGLMMFSLGLILTLIYLLFVMSFNVA